MGWDLSRKTLAPMLSHSISVCKWKQVDCQRERGTKNCFSWMSFYGFIASCNCFSAVTENLCSLLWSSLYHFLLLKQCILQKWCQAHVSPFEFQKHKAMLNACNMTWYSVQMAHTWRRYFFDGLQQFPVLPVTIIQHWQIQNPLYCCHLICISEILQFVCSFALVQNVRALACHVIMIC